MQSARTLSTSIARPASQVYAYLADPLNLPKWSAFITAIRPEDGAWAATTQAGEVRMRFCRRNAFGILDHTVVTASGAEIFVPLRVVPHGAGSEVIFTVFRQPAQDDGHFDADCAMVANDLACLKKALTLG